MGLKHAQQGFSTMDSNCSTTLHTAPKIQMIAVPPGALSNRQWVEKVSSWTIGINALKGLLYFIRTAERKPSAFLVFQKEDHSYSSNKAG